MCLAAGTGEIAVRLAHPTPRAQLIRGGGAAHEAYEIAMRHGQPTWKEEGSVERENHACVAPVKVAMFGSSITFGTSYSAGEVMSAFLQRDLDAAEPGRFCVHNWGQAAFTGASKLALATDVLPETRPAVVLWELWDNDPGSFTMVGKDAWNFAELRTGTDGLPWLIHPPGHAALFAHSQLYAFATVALSPLAPGGKDALWGRYIDEFLPRLESLVHESGSQLVFWVPAYLDRPFASSAAHRSQYVARVVAWAEPRGVPVLFMAEALGDTAVESVRHDTCCHLNPLGHELAAKAMAPLVRAAAVR